MNDAEIPAIIYDVFSAMGLKRFQIRINNRRVLNGFYSMLGLTEQSGEIMRTVDKIEKIGPDMVRAILVDDIKLTGEQADEILKFIVTSCSTAAMRSFPPSSNTSAASASRRRISRST